MKPKFDTSKPLLAELTTKIPAAGLKLKFDYDEDTDWFVSLRQPTSLTPNIITPNDLKTEDLLVVGTAYPGDDNSYLDYLLLDRNDPNHTDPQIIMVDSEEASLQFANRMLFSKFWQLTSELETGSSASNSTSAITEPVLLGTIEEKFELFGLFVYVVDIQTEVKVETKVKIINSDGTNIEDQIVGIELERKNVDSANSGKPGLLLKSGAAEVGAKIYRI